jgi:hypothetical protein
MFKHMKPLPKAIVIAAIVGLPIGAYLKFKPEAKPAEVVQAVKPTPVPAEADQPAVESAAVKRAEQLIDQAPAQAPAQEAPAAADSGMAALMNAGKK